MTAATPAESGPVEPTEWQPSEPRWWYLVLAVPVLTLVMLVVGFPVALFAMLAAVRFSVLLLFMLLLVVGVPLFAATVLLPLALYKDIEYVQSLDVQWDPDRDLYVLLGVVGIFVGMVSPVVATYYLYKRHTHLGRP